MANYLMKYKSKYRLLTELDQSTNDFPRDDKGMIEDNDVYISCQYGNKIFSYGHGILIAYIPSLVRGRNIVKALKEKDIPYTNYVESDEEVEFRFKAKDIEEVATLLKAKTSGAGISPFSSKNLPKAKDVQIPTDEIERYKAIFAKINKGDLLIISRITNEFLETILQKSLRKSDKKFDYKADIKKLCLARQVKEYIYIKNLWDEYLEYLDKKIDEYYNK